MPVDLSVNDLDRIETIIQKRKRVKRGEQLFRNGDSFHSLYAIRTGFFKTSVGSTDGREQVTGFQMAGEIMGLDGIVSDRHTCDAVALEDAEVCIMPFDHIEELSREINAWKLSLTKLNGEIEKSGNELTRANKIIQNARRTMDYPLDRTGLVDYIAASALLNRFMTNKAIKAEQTSEAYYLLGVTEALIGRSTWLTQTDYYFEAAVRASPKSVSANKAFDALEQQILMEYSGSGGTNIPEDIQANLDELRGLVKR